MIIRILVFLSLLYSFSSFAQKYPHEFNEVPTLVDLLEDEEYHSGFLSTIKFGMGLNSFEHDLRVSDIMNVESRELKLPSGKSLKYKIAYEIANPSYPLVIGHFGFSGDVDEGNAKYLAVNFRKDFPKNNLILIQTLSSNNSLTENGYASLGGILDSKVILETVSDMKERFSLSPDVKIICGSSSTTGVIQAGIQLKKDPGFNMNGVYIQSGYDSMVEVYKAIKATYLSRKERSRKGLEKTELQQRIFVKLLLEKRVKNLLESESVDKHISIDEKESFDKLLERTYSTFESDYKAVYKEFHGTELLASNVGEYYEALRVSNYTEELDFDVMWVHAKDDPMSPYKNLANGFNKLDQLVDFTLVLMDDGGHAAFKETYGNFWLSSVMRLFVDS